MTLDPNMFPSKLHVSVWLLSAIYHLVVGELRTGSKNTDIVKYVQTKAKSLPNYIPGNVQKEFLKKNHFYGAHPRFYGSMCNFQVIHLYFNQN